MVDIADLKARARALLLGPEFKPKAEDIPTPDILLAKMPELADALRLLGCSGEQAIDLRKAANGNGALMTALCICHAIRFRDPENTPLFSMTDANALLDQDVELSNELGKIVMPFLGLAPKAVEDAKNDSGASQKQEDGSPLPQSSEDVPSQNSNDESTTASS